MQRRRFSAEEKMSIVLMGLKGERPIAEICREHQISQSQYYRWRDRFLEGGKNALVYGAPSKKEAILHQSFPFLPSKPLLAVRLAMEKS